MQVIATNIGGPTTVLWKGKPVTTGIYKYPVERPLELDLENVLGDTVSDRKVHGGTYKACYLFSTEQYPYWKGIYPGLKWQWGMFGENLSMHGLDERELRIGSIYRLGSALVQVTHPREPCFKLGIRFGDPKIIREFIAHGHSGTYVRVLERGQVAMGDTMDLVEESPNPLTTYQFFHWLHAREKDRELLRLAVTNEGLSPSKRESLKKLV